MIKFSDQGRYNRRVTVVSKPSEFESGEYGEVVQFDGGVSWPMWADVQDRSGFAQTNEQQQVWNYDTLIKVRKETSRPISEHMMVNYGTDVYAIKDIRIVSEGFAETYELRCQKTAIQ